MLGEEVIDRDLDLRRGGGERLRFLRCGGGGGERLRLLLGLAGLRRGGGLTLILLELCEFAGEIRRRRGGGLLLSLRLFGGGERE